MQGRLTLISRFSSRLGIGREIVGVIRYLAPLGGAKKITGETLIHKPHKTTVFNIVTSLFYNSPDDAPFSVFVSVSGRLTIQGLPDDGWHATLGIVNSGRGPAISRNTQGNNQRNTRGNYQK